MSVLKAIGSWFAKWTWKRLYKRVFKALGDLAKEQLEILKDLIADEISKR